MRGRLSAPSSLPILQQGLSSPLRPSLRKINMKTAILSVLAAQAATIAAVSVSGSAEGFATGVTGGGDATAVYPTTTDELVSYLGDDEARVIVLQQTFDFRDTEGTTTATGCAPWGTASGCQVAIDQNDWCENYEPDAPSVSVTYDNAGTLGITVASDKSIIGDGDSGIILGKGLRLVSGVSNIIIQNIAITDINAEYVWGGDAITLDGADLVWIDHVTVSQHPYPNTPRNSSNHSSRLRVSAANISSLAQTPTPASPSPTTTSTATQTTPPPATTITTGPFTSPAPPTRSR